MSLGSCRVPTLPDANSVPMPPSMSPIPSPLVAPVRSESSWNSATCSIRCFPSSLSITARSWKVSARSAGPPTFRAYDVISPRSRPVAEIRKTSSPVLASSSGRPSSSAANQRPAA